MPYLKVYTQGDNCWPDLTDKMVFTGDLVSIARLEKGTVKGQSSVTLRIHMSGGAVILAQTTLALLASAIDAFRAAEDNHA